MSTTLLNVLAPKLKHLIFVLALATTLTACGNAERRLGAVDLKGEEETMFNIHVPPNPQDETGWRLRFGILPREKFDILKKSDQITVYLENNETTPLGFRERLNKDKVTILPGARIEVFQGALSELLMTGRGEEAAMVFDPTKTSQNVKLCFVPHLEQKHAYTIQISIFYYPSIL